MFGGFFGGGEEEKKEPIEYVEDGRGNEYKGLYGFYWCFEDRISKLSYKQGYEVKIRTAQFRQDHMTIKKMLEGEIIERDKLFPLYENRRLYQMKTRKLLKLTLDKERVDQIRDELADFDKDLMGLDHAPIYKKVYDFFMAGKIEEFYDALALMSHVYKSDVKNDRKMLESLSLKYEHNKRKAEIEGDLQERERLQQQVEDELARLDELRLKIDSRILDAEIFFRNTKHHIVLQTQVTARDTAI